ncbi:glycosyltransferase involved in cell wall biosynthesis [Lederbergia galactosidilyticus]|nr:glycosyltransferase involved in cell wall biosynthesis [Lederbergia galactosidilytica]
MNILVISHMYPSSQKPVNGVFVHEQVKAIVKKGHNVRVISPIPYVPFFLDKISMKWKKYKLTKPQEIVEGIPVYYPTYIAIPRNLNFQTSGVRMYSGFKQVVEKIYKEFEFDLIHSHVALPDGYAAMMVAEKYAKPLVVTIHGQDFQQTIHKNNKCKNAIEKVLQAADKTTLVSGKLNRIRKNAFPVLQDDNFSVINNGVSDFFIEESVERKLKTEITLLSVSNLIETKGIDLNIKALSKIVKHYPKIRYNIIGDGPQKPELVSLAKNLNLENNIFFLGTQSRQDVKKNMLEADVFILPSWNEAFGVVYIEAMATGLPVIGCKGEGIEDIVEDGKEGYLIDPKNVSELSEKILFLVSDLNIRQKLGENARNKVKASFTWSHKAMELTELYNNIHEEKSLERDL